MAALNTRITDLEPVDITKKVDPKMAYDQRPDIAFEIEKDSDGINKNITLAQLRKKILSDMYPVGTIYHSVAEAEPGRPIPPNILGLPGKWVLYGQNVRNSAYPYGGAPAALYGYKEGDSRFSVPSPIDPHMNIRGNIPTSSHNNGYLDVGFNPDHWGAYVFTNNNIPQHTHATHDYQGKTTAESKWANYNSKKQVQDVDSLEINIKPPYGLLSEHKYVQDRIIDVRDLGETPTNLTVDKVNGKYGTPYTTDIEISEKVYKKINDRQKTYKSGNKYYYKADTGDLVFVKYSGKYYTFQEVRECKDKSKLSSGDESKNKWTPAVFTTLPNEREDIPRLGTNLGEVFKPATTSDGKIKWNVDTTNKGYPYFNPVATPMPQTNTTSKTPTIRVKNGNSYRDITGFHLGDYVTYKETDENGVTSTVVYVYVNDPEIYTETVTVSSNQKKKSSSGSGGGGGGGGGSGGSGVSNASDPYAGFNTASKFLYQARTGKDPLTGESVYTVDGHPWYPDPDMIAQNFEIEEASDWYTDDTCDTNIMVTIEADDYKDLFPGEEPSLSDIMSGKMMSRLADAGKKIKDKITNPTDDKGKKVKSKSPNGAGVSSIKQKTVKRYKNVKKWVRWTEAYQCEYLGRTTTDIATLKNTSTSSNLLPTMSVTIKGNNKKFMPNNDNTHVENASFGDVAAYGKPGSEYILKSDDTKFVTAIDHDDGTVLYTYNEKKNAIRWAKEDTGFDILSDALDETTKNDETNKDILMAEPFAIAEHSETRNYTDGQMVAHNKKVYIADGNVSANNWETQYNAGKWILYEGNAYYAHDLSEKDKNKSGISKISYERGSSEKAWKTGIVLQPVKSDEYGTGEPGDNRPVPFSTHMHPGYGMFLWPNNGFTTAYKNYIMGRFAYLTELSEATSSQELSNRVAQLRSYAIEAFQNREAVVRGPTFNLYDGKKKKFNTNLYPAYPVEQDENDGWQTDRFEGTYRNIDSSAWSEWDNYNTIRRSDNAITINGYEEIKHNKTAINVLPPYVTAYRWVRYE